MVHGNTKNCVWFVKHLMISVKGRKFSLLVYRSDLMLLCLCGQSLFSLDHCIGIIGGRPRHSLYFVGFQGMKAILKRHSQLAHTHFIANVHVTETQQILFSPRYNKNNIIRILSKRILKNRFFSKQYWKSSSTLWKLKQISRWSLISGWGEN